MLKRNVKAVVDSSRQFLDKMPDPLFLVDDKLVVKYINKPALTALGYNEEEVINKMTCASLCRTPLCDTENCTMKQCMQTGEQVVGTTVARSRKDEMLPIRAQCNALFDGKGKAIGGFEYLSDVRTVDDGFLNNLSDPAFRTNKNLIVQNINKSALDLLGYREDEVLGKMTCADLCRSPLCNTENCTIKKAMKEKKSVVGTTVAYSRNGDVLPVRASCGYLTDERGNITGGFEVVSPINQLDEGFLSNMADPAFRVDTELIVQNINEPALQAMGYTWDEVVGKMTCADLCRTPVCKTENCTIKTCMKTGGTVVAETVARTKDNTEIPVRASCGALFDQTGKVTGGFEVISDNSALISMVDKAGIISKGDFTVEMEEQYLSRSDSIGKLASAFNGMSKALSSVLSQVRQSVTQVSTGAEQVSSSSQSLSQGATEQSSSLQQITASVTQIASQTKTNTENAVQANSLSQSAQDYAEKGSTQMGELIKAMEKINTASDGIKKIVKTIDDIAFQINILALNANVEAARAGKYGRGFAVVAEEVRSLAVRSAEAAKETTQMVENSINSIEEGNHLVGATAEQLKEITEGTQKVADLVSEIASAGKEQTAGIEQVTEGLGQIEEVTQSNTASAEEGASAAEELASMSEQLDNLVARFRLLNQGLQTTIDDGAFTAAAQIKADQGKRMGKRVSREQDEQLQEGSRNPKKLIKLDDDDFSEF